MSDYLKHLNPKNMEHSFTPKKTLIPFITFLLFSFFLQKGNGQCLTENLIVHTWVQNFNLHEGQTFDPDCSGTIEEVAFFLDESYSCEGPIEASLMSWPSCEVLWTCPTVPALPGQIITVDFSLGSGTSREVNNGTEYRLDFFSTCTNGGDTRYKLSDQGASYPGGQFAALNGSSCDASPQWDLWFRVGIDQALPPLPVELIDFSAREENGEVHFEFFTASENNNDYFALEHATGNDDGPLSDFRTIGKIKGAGTTLEKQEYEYVHKHPMPGTNYYRLKQVDYDGTFEYTALESVEIDAGFQAFNFYPNPVSDELHINIANWEYDGNVRILNLAGKELFSAVIEPDIEEHTLQLHWLSPGIYILELTNGRQRWQERFSKN